ncbi:hypothetical protein CAAN1_21S02476 [[Candida] anglica]|uniref:FAR-17a/AIG1-like protein n=1 Tax=[Candida] anglica TaxID=148631 RepID=A0ABP0EEH7_9ASCO
MARTVGNIFAIALNVVSISIGIFGISKTIYSPDRVLPLHLIGAGEWQFLTNLSLVYSLIVFVIGLISHVTKSQFLYRLKNDLHPVGLALETVVALVYWPLRIWFLHLLVKDPSSFALPLDADLAIHLMPVISLLVDYLAFMPAWTLKKSTAFSMCAILTTAYWFWLHHIIDFENGGAYPYNFLNVSNIYLRIGIFSLVGLTGFSSYLLMRNVYVWVVRKESTQ